MNPVHFEMFKMGKKWEKEIKKNPNAATYILLGDKHETQIFETYFKYQLSDDSKTEDVYMIHYQPFENSNKYGSTLVEEWYSVFQEWKEHYDIEDSWNPKMDSDRKTDAYLCIKALLELIDIYPELKENKIFIHLAPTAISSPKDFEKWMIECGEIINENKAHDFIKLVFTDHHQFRTIKNFYKPHFWSSPIDINNLMEKTAANTNRAKGAKDNDLQQLILKASTFLSKEKFEDADIILSQAIRLAVRENFTQGKILAQMVFAQSSLVQGEYNRAEKSYIESLNDAQKAGDYQIKTQVHYSYAGFFLMNSKREKAYEQYNEVIKLAQENNDVLLQIETHRILGQLFEYDHKKSEATSQYEKCIELTDLLQKEELEGSSIAYTASLLIKLYGKNDSISYRVNEKMKNYFGDDWENRIKIPEEISNYNKN